MVDRLRGRFADRLRGRSPDRGRARDGTAPLWFATAVLRVVTYLFAVVAVAVNYDGYARAWLAVTVLVVMGLWTPVTLAWWLRPALRRPWLVATDLLVTCALLLTSLWILSPAQWAYTPLVTTLWGSVPAVACGVVGGWASGAGAGLLIAVCTALARHQVNTGVVTDTVLLVGAGLVVGLAATTARRSTEALARALRTEAAAAERERLASSIHDSVLQVLARVRRRGAEVGGEAGELARMAGEQEAALRALVASGPVEQAPGGEVDLNALLRPLGSATVEVSAPGTPAMLPGAVADELAGAVREALLNTERHAGAGARAWVLVEDLHTEVVVSVRDDGAGIADGRLDAAATEGRLGVSNSIDAAVRHLGGTARLHTGSNQGTEWEMRVPRSRGRGRGGRAGRNRERR